MKVLSIALAVVVAVLLSYALGASVNAGRADLARDAQREPVLVPDLENLYYLRCGEQRTLFQVAHWPAAFHTQYVAVFRANGLPGRVYLWRVSGPHQSVDMALPPPDRDQRLTLELPVAQPADPLEPQVNWVAMTLHASPCTSKTGPDEVLVLRDLNLFVR